MASTALTSTALTSTALTSTAHPSRPAAESSPRSSTASGGLLVVAAVIVAVVAFFVLLTGDAAATSPATPTTGPAAAADTIEIYVVQPGDTLWGIATTIAGPGDDTAAIVDALNDIAGGADLEIGQRLVIDHAQVTG